jgi:hypothetical protein
MLTQPLVARCFRLLALPLAAALLAAPALAQRVTASPDAGKGELEAVRWFNQLDRNGDGKLERDEVDWVFKLSPKVEREFNAADVNHDNVVTATEIRALAAKRRAEREARRAAEKAAQVGSDADTARR